MAMRAGELKQRLSRPLRSPGLIAAADRMLLRRPNPPVDGRRHHVVLAPAGGGNIGDQALVEAFIENVDGDVTVICRRPTDYVLPGDPDDADDGRVRMLPLLSLVYGDLIGHLRDLGRFRAALRTATSFSVIGADVMDGGYGFRASTNRANLARRVAELGIDARILGFSWNASPDPRARDAVREAARRGVTTVLRDPRSAARARADGIDPVVDGADIVFLARSVDDASAAAWADRVAAPLALVNFSGLVPAAGGLDPYVAVVQELRDRGHGVLLVPHVSRPGADDLPLSRAVSERFAADDDVLLVDRLLTPAAIRGLTRRARVTVTGRMHLAVMSLMHGVPAVTVATQGKVEGLMELFGTPELCVPTDAIATSLAAVAATTADTADQLSSVIRARLDAVTELAGRNFVGLRRADRTVTSR
ncbi:polysaccharide pyruvyl transferase family protein [Agromyces sp. ISL-38]|uniref:polysaccharide pyruvyl transferase family protein n=1 Tax=Agromyces sp. ISL-38 TaxID=2819107 RepID=UPI001BEC4C37|nr:polysaccharide pyruvyl transferase family protein [Agromyces sp. ISL-38]MBT2498938.1 polysaccharide pyruvyl transferase family protein [Agromyces sp. ISL-38]